MGIALWLLPPKNSAQYETLVSVIRSLQPLFPDAPFFEPHITITSGIELKTTDDIDKVLNTAVAALQTLRDPLRVHLRDLQFGSKFFTKVNIGIEPTTALVSFAMIIRELFVDSENAKNWALQEFNPHLSLAYSENVLDMATKRIITIRAEDASLHGWVGGCLKLVNCDGPIEEWKVLGTVNI